MQSNERIALDFSKRIMGFFNNTHDWRRECAVMQAFYDGHPSLKNNSFNSVWEKLNNHPTQKNRHLPANAPMASAYVNYICGTMLQDEKQLVAYSVEESFDPQASTMNKGLKYIEACTGRRDVKYDQLLNASIRGVGGAVVHLDFTIDKHGYPVYERKDDIFFDTGLKGIVDSSQLKWCGYADAMSCEALRDYVENNLESDCKDCIAGTDFRSFLLEHKQYENESDIDFLYVYYWMEYCKIWDVDNPFFDLPEQIQHFSEAHPEAMNLFAETLEKMQLDIAQSHFTFDKDDYGKFKDLIANISALTEKEFDFEVNASSRMGRAYYRAEFAMGKMIKKSRAFTTQCHPMSFISCNYDKTLGYHYGMMRPLAYYQRMLNESMDNMLLHSGRAARGGTKVVTGSGVDAERFKKYIDNDEEVFFGDESLKINSITAQDTAPSTLQSVEVVLRLMPMSLGLQSNAFETLMSTQKTAEEVRHVKSMMASALYKFYSAMNRSTLNDGLIMRDMVYEIAGNVSESKQVTLTLDGKESSFALSKQNLSKNYAIRTIERAQTKDEKLAEFSMLREVIQTTIQDPAVLMQIAPILIDISPIDFDEKQKLIQAIQPPQQSPEQMQMQQQQSQMQIEQLAAQTRMINAQATQLEQQAGREQSASALNQQKVTVEIDKAIADIEHKQAQTVKAEADAASVIADIGMKQLNTVNNMGGV